MSLLLTLLLGTPEFAAAAIYKYVDSHGVVNYSSRPVAGAKALDFSKPASRGSARDGFRSLERGVAEPMDSHVRLETERGPAGDSLVVYNELFAPVEVRVAVSGLGNVKGAPDQPIHWVVPPRSHIRMLTLAPQVAGQRMRYTPKLSYAMGDPRQLPKHYQYPFPWLGGPFRQTQGANGRFSHNTVKSRYAVDVAMPRGTPIVAVRDGTVIRVVNDQREGMGGPAGNFVRVLHEDGTMSVYLHLGEGSVRVREGQRVLRGDRLASSGNTGHSTGAHLHFVVQRNTGLAVQSIPFRFAQPLDGQFGSAVGGD